jgi:hypothetical protein
METAMAHASNFLEAALLEHLRGTPLPLPPGLWLALHTADPTDAAHAATEVNASGAWPAYARQSLGVLAAAWNAPAADPEDGVPCISNAVGVRFPKNNGAAALTVTHYSFWDDANNGNMWLHGPLLAPDETSEAEPKPLIPTPMSVAVGDTLVLDPATLTVKLTGVASAWLRSAVYAHLAGTQMPMPAGFYVGVDGEDASAEGNLVTEADVADWPTYARQSVGTPLAAAWTAVADEAGDGKVIAIANAVSFPPQTAGTLTITAFSLWDAPSGGNMWLRAPLATAKELKPNYTLDFEPGTLRPIAR